MDSLRIAVVGNSFASRVQLPALRHVGRNRVVGLAGADSDKAARVAAEWSIEVATTDYRDLLALEPDLVLVTTPVNLHREMGLAVLESGAALLLEKPFALHEEEAAELVAAAEGRQAWIDHQLRWTPPRRALRRRIEEGWLGDLWHVAMDFSVPAPDAATRPWRWWYDRAAGGGILGALGSHMVDLLRHELGPVAAVRAQLDTFVTERTDAGGTRHAVTADDHAEFSLRFASGVRADLRTSLALPHAGSFQTRYAGSGGTLVVDGEERLLEARPGDALTPADGVDPLPTHTELDMPDGGPFARALPLYLRDVVAAVREKRPLEGAATFADGLAVQRVLDGARASHDSGGGWVELAP